jgi:hypothetical protein
MMKVKSQKVLQRLAICDFNIMSRSSEPQRAIANMFVKLIIELLCQRTWSMSLHTTAFPEAFAGIFIKDEAKAEERMTWVRDAWECLRSASLSTNPMVEKVLKDVAFHDWTINVEFYAELLLAKFNKDGPAIQYLGWALFARRSNTKAIMGCESVGV